MAASDCDFCKADRSNKNHLAHVRELVLKTYGHDHCVRKGCTDPIGAPSGYCTAHHAEWVHGENARSFSIPDGSAPVERTVGTCPKCGGERVKGSGYCRKCRNEYMRSRYRRLRSS